MPTLIISIDRSDMVGAPAPLVLSGTSGDPLSNTALGASGYREPARQARVRYAPASDFAHGEVALGWNWQQSLLQFTAMAPAGTSESVAKAAIAELEEAITRLSYSVTVTVDDAPAYTWACVPGSVTPTADRSYVDLKYGNATWAVDLPCNPVPVIGA